MAVNLDGSRSSKAPMAAPADFAVRERKRVVSAIALAAIPIAPTAVARAVALAGSPSSMDPTVAPAKYPKLVSGALGARDKLSSRRAGPEPGRL